MNVLVATDGSKHAGWGLNWVDTLPFVKPPRVTVLHVLDIARLRAPFLEQPVMAGTERYIQEEIRRMEARAAKTLKGAKQQLAAQKLKGTVRKEQGAVAPTILKRAPKRDGLLVVGSQGLDALDRFMLGSVSTNLIHHSTCPVLVVKGEASPLRRVVLATDGSSSSAKALAFVLAKFRPNRSTGKGGQAPTHVDVIHVMPPVKYPGLEEANRKLIEQSVRKLIKAGFTAEPLCEFGNPAEEIMKAASTHHADLIVMGAKGLGAIARFLLGSVSTRVAQHANCSVLVVR
ncbi:MAG: universal stress protein [Nitrospiraceae bacterium]|jgi:nucleotide-binding universal stress UspA family protein|nr:universal stress protein [Nitrospiraceae bacterium]